MPRKGPKPAASLVVAALLAAASSPADARQGGYKPTVDDKFYVACYIFTSGVNLATAFPPVKANGAEMFNYFEGNLGKAALPLFPQHHSIRCVAGDTPEEASQNRIAQGYALEPQPWPKGLPEAARPVYFDGKGYVPAGTVMGEVFYTACYAFEPSAFKARATPSTWLPVVRATGAEILDDLPGRLKRSLARSLAPEAQVVCRTGDTPEAAEEGRAWHYVKAAEAPWPADVRLASLGSKAPPPPPKKAVAAPKPAPVQTASLTIKEDTSAKDAAKAWDEQVKKTLAAEAQKKVETAAKAAQADARQKAQIEAFWAERRRQGNRQ